MLASRGEQSKHTPFPEMLLDEPSRTTSSRQAALLALRATIHSQQHAHLQRPLDRRFLVSAAEYSDAERAAAETLLMMPTPEQPSAPARRFCFAAKAPPALAWDSVHTPLHTPIRA